MAAHAEIFLTSSPCAIDASVSSRISSFCRCATRVALTVRMSRSCSRKALGPLGHLRDVVGDVRR
jgi:hypothetical protein